MTTRLRWQESKPPWLELPGVTVDEVKKGSVTCSGEDLDTAAIVAAIEGIGFGATVAN